jgi:kinetochore protein NDC80|tara:strand:+ start:992 stop:2614 length:1623 start_codon:yes stop_codon:yes gene_type:complete
MPGADGRSKPKDPRQISDKSYMHKSIRKLIHYLSEHGYDRAISPQILNAPTTKDFVHILSFLLRSLDPNFAFVGKYEDELPVILRTLGYPSNVSKSALSAVGSPHTWPHLLAALSWLVDLGKYSEAVFEREAGDSFDNDDGNKVFIDYLSKAYQLFLAGDDDTTVLEEQIAFIFDSKNSGYRHDIEALEGANSELSSQYSELTEGTMPLQKALNLNRDLKSDTAKFEKHIHDLQEHRSKVSDRLESEEAERSARQAELSALAAEIGAHKETISKQELTPADVERMCSERKHLKAELSQLKEQREQTSKQNWEEEVEGGKAIDRLEAKVQEANSCEQQLQATEAGARALRGLPLLEVLRHKLASHPDEALGADVHAELKPALLELKASFAHEHVSAQDQLLEAEQQQTKREEEKQERLDQLAGLKGNLQRQEKEERLLKEQQARELEGRHRETEVLHEQILAVRSSSGNSLLHSQSERATLQKEYDSYVAYSQHAREKMYNQLVSALDLLTIHKEHMEKQLESLHSHLGAKAQQLEPLLAD